MRQRTIGWAAWLAVVGIGAARGGDGPTVVGVGPPATAPTTPTPDTGQGPSPGQGGDTPTTPRFPTARIPGAVGGGIRYFGPPYWVTVGPYGPVVIGPPPPTYVIVNPNAWPGAGPLGGPPPPGAQAPAAPAAPVAPAAARPKRGDGARRDQLVTIGDRLFRAGNLKRAEERFVQALKADPDSAAPLVRLAQVALARDDYGAAARRFRESVAVEPDWLPRANGIAAMYGEPAELDRVIARLESHVLTRPSDRDAWLSLGAQYFLTGKTRRAADVFARLSDRKADAALAAFRDATKAAR